MLTFCTYLLSSSARLTAKLRKLSNLDKGGDDETAGTGLLKREIIRLIFYEKGMNC